MMSAHRKRETAKNKNRFCPCQSTCSPNGSAMPMRGKSSTCRQRHVLSAVLDRKSNGTPSVSQRLTAHRHGRATTRVAPELCIAALLQQSIFKNKSAHLNGPFVSDGR
jgi:hypothetical protein